MSRIRPAAAVLAAVAAIAAAATWVQVSSGATPHHGSSLSPTPPVPLPAHAPTGHHVAHHTKPAKHAGTPLPNTGMDPARELIAALALVLGGLYVRLRSAADRR
jgi:hypothetical protein